MSSLVLHVKGLPRMGVSMRSKQDAAMRYSLRMSSASEFNKVLRPFTEAATVRECRMGMSRAAWFPLNLRLVAYKYAEHGSEHRLQLACDRLHILDADRDLIRRFVFENRKAMQRISRRMYGDTVPHPEAIRKRCGEAVMDIRRATAGIVNRRLRFVEVFNSVPRDELLSQVQERQVQQFYWSYTREVDEGAAPWMVTVAANAVRNLATRYSAQCRKNSTDRDSSGTSQLLIVSNLVRSADNAEVNLYDKAIDPSPSAESNVSAEHILRVLEDLAITTKQRRFFEILVSDHDLEFDAWLSLRGLIKPHQTHADYRAKHGLDRFIERVSEMLCVPPSKPRLLLKKARAILTSQGYD